MRSNIRSSSAKERARSYAYKVGTVSAAAIRMGNGVNSATSKLMLYSAFYIARASSKGDNSARMSHFS